MCAESASIGILEIKNKKESRHKLLWFMKSPREGPPADANKPLYSFHVLLAESSGKVFIIWFVLEASPE